jgi:hypothetical protein
MILGTIFSAELTLKQREIGGLWVQRLRQPTALVWQAGNNRTTGETVCALDAPETEAGIGLE